MKYQYKTEKNIGEFEINQLAKEGWILVFVCPSGNGFGADVIFYFKKIV